MQFIIISEAQLGYPDALAAYLDDPENNSPPKEQEAQPDGHVPYNVDSISVADVLLSGAVAELDMEDPFPSQKQHDSMRCFLHGRRGVRKCFKKCPLC